jgi:hypothetical protein
MPDTETLTILRAARNLLDKSYIKWNPDDGKGGHCAIGAICKVALHMGYYTTPIRELIDAECIALHPELVGKVAPRENTVFYGDTFSLNPTVYVNNQLGKAAILAVFDSCILNLELKLSPAPEETHDRSTEAEYSARG